MPLDLTLWSSKETKQLTDLQITIKLGDQLNKNSNAVVDKACQEIQLEIRKILPEGQNLDNTILAKAIISLNTKLRRQAKVSAYEIHTAGSLDTGENLDLDDHKLRKQQLESRSN